MRGGFEVVDMFEQEVAKYTGAPYAVATASCTSALLLVCAYHEVDNLTMANLVSDIMDKDLEYEMMIERGSGQGYDLRYCLDGTKLRELGWNSERSLQELLEQTIKWTIENQEWV